MNDQDPPKIFPLSLTLYGGAGVGSSTQGESLNGAVLVGGNVAYPLVLKNDMHVLHPGAVFYNVYQGEKGNEGAGFATVGYSYGAVQATLGMGAVGNTTFSTKAEQAFPIDLYSRDHKRAFAGYGGLDVRLEGKQKLPPITLSVAATFPLSSRDTVYDNPESTQTLEVSGQPPVTYAYSESYKRDALRPSFRFCIAADLKTPHSDLQVSPFFSATFAETPRIEKEIISHDPTILENFKEFSGGEQHVGLTVGLQLSVPYTRSKDTPPSQEEDPFIQNVENGPTR